MPNENPYLTITLTITLTARSPVKIKKSDWEVIASAEESKHDNQYECQANRRASWKLIVRQHADGRTLVYAIHTYSSQWQGEGSRDVRGGEMIQVAGSTEESVGDTGPIVEAIQRVADAIEARMDDGQWSDGVFPRLAHECIADLPAEVI